MMIAGIVLLVLGFLLHIGLVLWLGVILLLIGAVLLLVGAVGHPVAGRRHYW